MRTIFAMILLCIAVAFAGCEPAGNNNSNAGNSGNGGTPTEPGTTAPTDPTNPTGPTDPANPGTTAGPWKVEEWQAWLDNNVSSNGGLNGGGRIQGVTSLTAFCDWANTYFPDVAAAFPAPPVDYNNVTVKRETQFSARKSIPSSSRRE